MGDTARRAMAHRHRFDLTSVDRKKFVAYDARARDVSRCSRNGAELRSQYAVSDVFTQEA